MRSLLVILTIFMMGCMNGPPETNEVEFDPMHATVDLNLYRLYYVNFEYDGNITWDWKSEGKDCEYFGVRLSITGVYDQGTFMNNIVLHASVPSPPAVCEDSGELDLGSFIDAPPNDWTVEYWQFGWYGYTEITYNINLE